MLIYLTAGESHGRRLTAIVNGLPAGLKVDADAINYQLARRQKGYGRGKRMEIEHDRVEIVSGVRHGRTTGAPITLDIANRDGEKWKSVMDPESVSEPDGAGMVSCPRPGHADLAGGIKYGHRDFRNVLERASARETAARVAVGTLARGLLEHFGVRIVSHVLRIGSVVNNNPIDLRDLEALGRLAENSPVGCVDPDVSVKMQQAIDEAAERGDSLGGVAELIIRGVPAGLGGYAQWSERLDGRLAGAVMAVPSVKGVEIGLGFEAAGRFGSRVHDEIFFRADGDPAKKRFYRSTNNAGGLEGGITNGEDIVIRAAGKPMATLAHPLASVDVMTGQPAEAAVERADVCAVKALGVIGEAVVALILADAFLDKFGSDNMEEIERHYRAFLDTEF